MEVLGRVKVINPVQQVSASFKKRELVVTTEEQYPQHILIEFTQDKTDLLNNYNVGEQVKVSINLRGREWVNPQGETKYFNSIQGWRIEKHKQKFLQQQRHLKCHQCHQQPHLNQQPTLMKKNTTIYLLIKSKENRT